MKTNIKSRIFCIVLCLLILFPCGFTASAENNGSNDLVILQKALLNKIEYTSEWLDINGDTDFNLTDLIRLKKYLAGENVVFNDLKYNEVTFVSGENRTVQRFYKNACHLPELVSPYKYWKIGKNYYNANDYLPLDPNATLTITATESKKDVDLPFMPF